MKARCHWCPDDQPIYVAYHDQEWGVPVYDDRILFEFLILEGAQAGLSWYTILKKREGYRRAFCDYDSERVAAMSDEELESLREDEGIVRNRLKIYSARKNARVFLAIQKEWGSFSDYLWSHVNGDVVTRESDKLIVHSPLSDTISCDLKKRGMSFVGTTIMYAYLQAVGVVDDHDKSCFKYHGNA